VPGYLGTRMEFKKNFENTIMHGRNADASELQVEKCQAKLRELNTLVNRFVIRRTNDLLTKYRKPTSSSCHHCRMLTSLFSTISSGQVRACGLLLSFAFPARSISPFRFFARNQAPHQRKRLQSSCGYRHPSKALQPPRSCEPRARFTRKRKAVPGRLFTVWKKARGLACIKRKDAGTGKVR
jgi:hypothetical protein